MDKKQLRKDMIQKRLSLSDERFSSYCQRINETLEQTSAFQNARNISIYVSYRHEADTRELMQKHFDDKVFGVPRIEDQTMNFYQIHSLDELAKGYFGVDEPVTNHLMQPSEFDLVIVPLLMFDANHNRIGYGAGFYDHFLKDLHVPKIGLAFSFQQIEDTKPHPLDVPLDAIITEKGII